MSGHRGVLAAVALLLLAAVPACGFADDNYENAQAALDRSKPNLTVPETVTTMKPYQTIPGDDTSGSIPVELATPAQRAAALAEAQQRADDRKAGRPTSPTSASGGATSPGGAPTGATTTTVPDTAACRATRALQETGVLLVTSKGASPADYRAAIAAAATSFRALAPLLPGEQRNVATVVAAAFAPVEERAAASTSTAAMRADVRAFLAAQGKNVTTVLKGGSVVCPQVLDDNLDQAETVQFGD